MAWSWRSRLRLSAVAWLVTSAVSIPTYARAETTLSVPQTVPGEVRGVFAIRGDVELAAEGADQRLTPASVLKLVVAAAAFDVLGTEYRFLTEIYAPQRQGRSEPTKVGQLLVVAAGDPSWNADHFENDVEAPLKQLAAGVAASGIKRVEGDLIVDTSRVVGRRVPTGWSASDASLGYGAAPSALAWRDNRSKVRIAPGARVGALAQIEALDPIVWHNDTTTAPAERDGRGSVEFDQEWGAGRAVLRGEYPITERPFTVEIATPNPDERTARALLDALSNAGVVVTGDLVLRSQPQARDGFEQVAAFESPPLRAILQPLLADSNNFTAEMLLRTVGYAVHGEGRLDLGLDALTEFLVERVGVPEESFSIDDGSGLSPSNLVSARSVVRVLQWAWKQPWRTVYFDAMASESAGTIKDFWPRAPAIRGKTGTLRHTQCLAGVLLPQASSESAQEREPIFFAWMINHSLRERTLIRRSLIDTLWSWSRQ